jgi:hypothetical protein
LRQQPDYFENKEPVLIYIAKKLNEALRLEQVLSGEGIDYGVETDEYRGGVVFRSARTGAFFYVAADGVPAAHDVMRRHGFEPQPEDAE